MADQLDAQLDAQLEAQLEELYANADRTAERAYRAAYRRKRSAEYQRALDAFHQVPRQPAGPPPPTATSADVEAMAFLRAIRERPTGSMQIMGRIKRQPTPAAPPVATRVDSVRQNTYKVAVNSHPMVAFPRSTRRTAPAGPPPPVATRVDVVHFPQLRDEQRMEQVNRVVPAVLGLSTSLRYSRRNPHGMKKRGGAYFLAEVGWYNTRLYGGRGVPGCPPPNSWGAIYRLVRAPTRHKLVCHFDVADDVATNLTWRFETDKEWNVRSSAVVDLASLHLGTTSLGVHVDAETIRETFMRTTLMQVPRG